MTTTPLSLKGAASHNGDNMARAIPDLISFKSATPRTAVARDEGRRSRDGIFDPIYRRTGGNASGCGGRTAGANRKNAALQGRRHHITGTVIPCLHSTPGLKPKADRSRSRARQSLVHVASCEYIQCWRPGVNPHNRGDSRRSRSGSTSIGTFWEFLES